MTTTTEAAPWITPPTANELLRDYKIAVSRLATAQAGLGHIEQEIHARIDAAGGTALVNSDGGILLKRKHVTPTYDMALLVALKEKLTDEAIAEVFYDAWDEPKTIHHEAGYNGTQLNKWATAVGWPVREIMDRAALATRPGKLELPDAQLQKPGAEG